MINTSVFASLERFRSLESALLCVKDPLHPYHWMHDALMRALRREVRFMRFNKEVWDKEVGNLEEELD